MGRFGRWRRRVAESAEVRRLVRTLAHYRDRDGNHHAAALTFFTLLALVPLLMLAVSVAGFVLAADAEVLAQLDAALALALPVGASGAVGRVVHIVVAERGSLGVVALAVALFSGWSWISHVRDSVTAVLGQPRPRGRLLRTVASDVLTLLGIGLALVLSFTSAALTGRIGTRVLDLVGLSGTVGSRVFLTAGSLVLGLLANWVVVGWCLAKLPRARRPIGEVLVPAAVGALGLALLQQLGGLYLALIVHSPAVATLGALVGLLLFVYTLMRWLLLVTVWSATSAGETEPLAVGGVRTASGTLAVGASAGSVVRVFTGR
ncbi:YihY/virulence factor BrkB family protein [Actinomycetospora termitidis]|uniref:YhjD/YihY/BrkB family envelope integrity protein n=1 Tax=Actinomycetospora termitidis TaxID=3053470 RepID=A0ABT7MF96_9PSEU|nr:YhjD/YihY/BrkB family envelope integrity protein [Actinomycetospora sp. Odt1-22]MDL5159334.1 YhjD/YihY/BrkB family envelope integrity protein [Actinomycetospora sp. Odt1-22]